MTPFWQFVLGVITAILGSVPAIITVWLKLEGMHKHMNSRLDELIAAKEQISRAAGVVEGLAEKNRKQ